MSSKMVIRILSISLALVLFGMVAPSLTNASVGTQGEVDLGQVLINSSPPTSTTLAIHNQNKEKKIYLLFRLELEGNCGFSYSYDETLYGTPMAIEPDDTVSMTIEYAPSKLDVCSDTLVVSYFVDGEWFLYRDAVSVVLTGEGVDKVAPLTVMIDGQDTGVENKLYKDGRYVSEWLDDCASARNHGEYVRCVALLTKNMKKGNLLNEEEKGAIMKAAAHANIPPRKSSIEDLSHDGTPVTELIKDCKENAESNRQYMSCVSDLMRDMKKDGVIKTGKDKHLVRRYAARLRFHSKPHK